MYQSNQYVAIVYYCPRKKGGKVVNFCFMWSLWFPNRKSAVKVYSDRNKKYKNISQALRAARKRALEIDFQAVEIKERPINLEEVVKRHD
ncbi:MAG TPA: hypothetical protein ENI23_17410 [bacterium]|nr:hypothetical protein [bacterium]